jgi:hypothetical protein
MVFTSNIFIFITIKERVMKNYILIISILTLIVVFLTIYLNGFVKHFYFDNVIDDFKDIYSILANATNAANAANAANASSIFAYENFENSEDAKDAKAEYEKLLESRRIDYYEKLNPAIATKMEESLAVQAEFYNNGAYDRYSTINDPISDEYLPYTVTNYRDMPSAISNNNINEYTIINVYKNTLDRQPTDEELKKHLQDFHENDMDEDILKLRIYNSTEYKIITNMQSNDIKPDLIANISKGQLKDKIKRFYMEQHNTELLNTKLLDILIKCYIHLQFNDYLFKAMLMHDNYMVFENRLRDAYILSDEKILEIFNRSFILYELRLIANELKRQDIIKRKALATPVSLYQNGLSELSSSNVNMGASRQITDIVKNSDNVFNINIMVNDKDKANKRRVPPAGTVPYSRNRPRRRPPNNRQESSNIGNQPNSKRAEEEMRALYNRMPNSDNIGGLAQDLVNKTSGVNAVIGEVGSTAAGTVSVGTLGNLGAGTVAGAVAGAVVGSGAGAGAVVGSGASTGSSSGSGAGAGTGTGSSSGSSASAGAGAGTGAGTGAGAGTGSSSSGASGTSNNNGNYDEEYKKYDEQYGGDQYGGDQYEDEYYVEDDANQPAEGQFPNRVYDPIDYKYHYRGQQAERPNVCSYGTKQVVQPVFLNSSALFQGTDLKEAAENTQVGSIMPKFEYYEYEDITE